MDGEAEAYEAQNISFCSEQETVTLQFAKSLSAGAQGVLNVSFTGNLNDKMKGFYRSKYFTPSGEERYGGVTQLYVKRHKNAHAHFRTQFIH